jgi:CDP-glucose 4,6-dehydratase
VTQILTNIYFWKNKRILITGHSGFVGAWLFHYLNKKKIQVFGISLKPEKKTLHYLLGHNKNKNSYTCDINNFSKLEKIIKKIRPNIIVHLAAQSLVIESVNQPINTYKTNIFGTLNILTIIKKYSFIKSSIFFTSDKIYENNSSKNKFNESHKLNGDDPYSGSKAASEIVINSYKKTFLLDKNVIVLRAGNIVGGGDYAKYRIIPDIIRSCINKKTLQIRNSKATRPWQHVLDVISAIIKILEKTYYKKSYHEIFNIGNNTKSISVSAVLKIAIKYFSLNINFKKIKTIDKKILNLNCLKIFKKLKIKNIYSQKIAIEEAFKWYNDYHLKKIRPKILCDNEIKKYESRNT